MGGEAASRIRVPGAAAMRVRWLTQPLRRVTVKTGYMTDERDDDRHEFSAGQGVDAGYEEFTLDPEEIDADPNTVDPVDSRVLTDILDKRNVESDAIDVERLIDVGLSYMGINRFEEATETFERAAGFADDARGSGSVPGVAAWALFVVRANDPVAAMTSRCVNTPTMSSFSVTRRFRMPSRAMVSAASLRPRSGSTVTTGLDITSTTSVPSGSSSSATRPRTSHSVTMPTGSLPRRTITQAVSSSRISWTTPRTLSLSLTPTYSRDMTSRIVTSLSMSRN